MPVANRRVTDYLNRILPEVMSDIILCVAKTKNEASWTIAMKRLRYDRLEIAVKRVEEISKDEASFELSISFVCDSKVKKGNSNKRVGKYNFVEDTVKDTESSLIVTVKQWDKIKGKPFLCVINMFDDCEISYALPINFNTVEMYEEYVQKRLGECNLTERGKNILSEFAIFKYQSVINPLDCPESQKAYYNMLVYAEELSDIDEFAENLVNCIEPNKDKVLVIDEKRVLSNYQGMDFDELVKNKRVVYIKDCQDKPVIDENAGTGSAREASAKIANLYERFWKQLAEYTKKNPTVTFIVGMTETVYRNTFKVNNDLNYRIFGHRIYIPAMTVDQVVSYCVKEFKNSSIELSDSFLAELKKYIKAIYKGADLQGIPFAKDVINRVYSNYFRKPIKDNILDVDCIPFYHLKTKSIEDVMEDINNMVGLQNVKEVFQTLYKRQVASPDSFKKENHHMMFYGNPGTGKTTVAKYVAQFMNHIGVLRTSKCIEATVEDLISLYKTGTATKTKNKVKEALDGVLFIDEAYGLATESEHAQEALNILVQEMVKYQDRLVVIFAGYEDKMESLLKTNAGLSSRITHKVRFDDYSVDELKEIFYMKCKNIGFTLDSSAENLLTECLDARRLQDFYGNGRDIDVLIGELQGAWSSEVYEIAKGNSSKSEAVKKVFYARHFADLMPQKNNPAIEDLIGLDTVKKLLKQFEAQVKYTHTLKEMGMSRIPETYMHMLFSGNPGTGKTTVAKMIANDLYSIGVLKTNRLVIAERKDIISPYRGGTSKQIEELIRKSVGGVLFIDEAYSLAESGADGAEAIEALLTAMVDHKDDTVIIFAGYPMEMRKLLKVNPGLQSRIGYIFPFADYSVEELGHIFAKQMKEAGFTICEGVLDKVMRIMEYFSDMPRFGNGRFVEQVISKIILKRAERSYTKDDYNVITLEDIPSIGEIIEDNMSMFRLQDPESISEEARVRVAYHELGHAIAIYELKPSVKEIEVSLNGSATTLGKVSISRDYSNRTEEDLQNEIVINLAGRCSEKVFLGCFDEGCISDFEQAKSIADWMVNQCGMGDLGNTDPVSFLKIGDELAVNIIEKYKDCIEVLSKDLLKGNKFTGTEFRDYVDEFLKK